MQSTRPQPAGFAPRILSKFLAAFFQLLYNQFARCYDLVAAVVSVGRWKTWVLAVLPYVHGPAVLEIGHGPGHLQKALCLKGLKPVALDTSRQMGLITRKRLLRMGFNPGVINGYAQLLPFPDDSFDQVVATFPTEYIYAHQTLSEIYRVLRPDGELLLTPVAWIQSNRIFDRLMAWLFKVTGQTPQWDEQFAQPFRQHHFDPKIMLLSLASSSVLIVRAVKQPPR